MKRYNNIYNLIAALAVGMTAGGCSDDAFENIGNSFEGEGDVTLSLNLPAFSVPSTRGVDANAISDVKVYYYNGTNQTATEDVTSVVGNKITLKVPGAATSVKLVANYTACGLTGNEMSFDPNDKTNMVFYGESTVADLKKTNPSVNLYRSYARTTFTNSSTDFEIENFYFCGKPSKGSVSYGSVSSLLNIPSGLSYGPSTQNGAEKVTNTNMTSNTGDYFTGYYHYEAAAGTCFWIIEGKYNGNETPTFYKVAYIKKDDTKNLNNPTGADNSEELPIIRNNHYQFTIEGVNSDGYATFDEAVDSKADNRLEVLLTNYEESIYDMVSCRDYYLGVEHEVSAPCMIGSSQTQKVNVTFNVVSNYKDAPTVEKSFEGDTWATITQPVAEGSVNEGTVGTLYKVSVSLEPNTESSNDRNLELVVKVGDLKKTVYIRQEGSDFFFGANRWLVGITGPSDALPSGFTSTTGLPSGTSDYFKMLNPEETGRIQGVTEEEMGVPRNDGLHFSVYVDGESLDKQFKYYIPKISEVNDGEIKIERFDYKDENDKELFTAVINGSNIEVACTSDGNKNYKIWHGRLKVKQGQQEVVYEIYHSGIFHNLKTDNQMTGPDGKTKTGWFYYEQVDVNDKDGNTYHILDRNMGASSNKFYSPLSSFYKGNESSRGAYFYVGEKASMGSVEDLLPKGFNSLPGKYHFQQLPPTVYSAVDGMSGWTSTNSLISTIYLPVAGSMDGTNHTDEMHAQVWSSTMVEGIQGFYPGEADYGMWYRILDVYGSVTVPTVRIKSRATGADRGLPIRAMSCPPAAPGADLPDVANSRSRIILENEAGWSNAMIVCEGVNCTADMVKGDNQGTWYYMDIKGTPTKVYFTGKKGSTARRTEQFNVQLSQSLVQTFSNKAHYNDPNPPAETKKYRILWSRHGDYYRLKFSNSVHSNEALNDWTTPESGKYDVSYGGTNYFCVDYEMMGDFRISISFNDGSRDTTPKNNPTYTASDFNKTMDGISGGVLIINDFAYGNIIYFECPDWYDQANVYCWNNSGNNGGYPGESLIWMKDYESNGNKVKLYKYETTTDWNNLKFSRVRGNNYNETQDLSFKDRHIYYFNDKSTTDGEYKP